MKIGELSRRSGVSVRMLRYYEEQGLLAPDRTDSSYRDYDTQAMDTLRCIKLLAAGGLTLPAIRELLPCVRGLEPTFQPCDELRSIQHRQVGLLDERLKTLLESRRILAGFLDGLPPE